MDVSTDELFRELYEDTSRRVYAYLRRHSDPDVAETVLAEVYLKAWKHLAALADEPMGWLIVTAKRTLVDHHRAQQRRNRLMDRLFTAACNEVSDSPESIVVDRHVVLNALGELGEEDREALLLVGWDGLSHVDAARVAGCSVPAFTKRLSRARSRLTHATDPVCTMRIRTAIREA